MVASSQILSDCVYMWERTVMGISVHTAETEMAKTPYNVIGLAWAYIKWHYWAASMLITT